MLDSLMSDLRYATRMLMKNPGVTLAVVLTLALGIGANTALFTVVNALLLRPLPVERPGEMVFVYTSDFSGPLYGASSLPDFEDFRQRTQTLSSMAAYHTTLLGLTTENQSAELLGEAVSGNYFQVLGLRAAMGRAIQPADDAPGAEPVVMLGHGLWQNRFGGDPAVVGTRVRLNAQLFTVIGIAPPNYAGMLRIHPSDVWIPLTQIGRVIPGRESSLEQRGSRSVILIGRLRPGASLESAQSEFRILAQQQYAAYPQDWRNVRGEPREVTLVPESEARIPPAFRGNLIAFLALLMGVVGLVLLIACANVANVLLARAAARRREMAIRLALGAGRGRLVRQLLTESMLLAGLGTAAGLLLALWGTDALMAFKPPLRVPLELELTFDARVVVFTLAVGVLTSMLFGLAPAMGAARTALVTALKEEGSSAMGGKSRLRSAFVVVQVTFSVVLLVAAGLFVRSLRNATLIDPGFDPHGALIGSLDLRAQGYDDATGTAFYSELHQRLRALPGVESASLVTQLPLSLTVSRRSVTIEGYLPQPGEDMEIATTTAGPDYFQAMRIPLLRGRGFTDRDLTGAPRVVVVSEAFVRRYWAGQEGIGKRIWMGRMTDGSPMPDAEAWEIVGVARDGKYGSLGEETRPFFYLPLLQFYRPAATLVVRTRAEGVDLTAAVTEEVRALDPALPMSNVTTLLQHLNISLLAPQIAASVLGLFGGVALLLAAVGLYGVMAYTVAQRTREIGIRIALGAGRGDILKMVMQQGMKLVAAGVVLGLAGTAAVTGLVASFLHGVSPYDALTFAGVAALLVAVTLLACWIPARRATRVDPMVALRYE